MSEENQPTSRGQNGSRRRRTIATAVAAALVAGGGGLALVGGPEHAFEALTGAHGGKDNLGEFVKEHKGINRHSQAAATVMEKLEGGAESAYGPNQMMYENLAFPRASVAQAQVNGSRAAVQAAAGRGGPKNVGTWMPLANSTGTVPGAVTYTGIPSHVSGRTTAIVVDPNGRTAYVGTAGGGVWKTDDITAASPAWRSIGDALPTQAIGSLTLANGTLYVGTGEPNGSSDSEAGEGLFKSTDGGATFSEVTGFHNDSVGRSISSVAVDPSNPQHLLVGTIIGRHGASAVPSGRMTPPGAPPIGLYESTDGGATWSQPIDLPQDVVNGSTATGGDYERGGVTQVALDPQDPSTVYAAVSDYGLYRRTAGQSDFTPVYKVATFGQTGTSSASRLAFAATVKDGKTRIYLGDATRFGSVSGLMRTDDATAATVSWTTLSNSSKSSTGYDSYNFCEGQCWYDMAVSTPPGEPDTVLLSGSMNYNEIFTAHQPSNGRAVIRSTDAGVSFTDMTNDAAGNGLHPDQHALAFIPGHPDQWVVGDDGGVAVESGPFVDKSADCDTRGLTGSNLANCKRWLSAVPTSNKEVNQGLQTLQYQSVSVGPNGLVQGGTQDNGTWESDYPGGWAESVGGDGGNSYIDPSNSNIRVHTYYGEQLDVNFKGSDPTGWDWIGDPLLASGENSSFYMPVEGDRTAPGTVYVGLQHVWRTTDNGGPRAFLDKHCNEFTGDFTQTCGDWQPLGGDKGDLSGSAYGSDYAGAANYVVAVTHAQRKSNILWAATRRGRLFISTNANADASSVEFTRLDQTAVGDKLPTRFVSGISLDPADPYHAIVSYGGYSAYAAGGHVYDVRYNPATKTITAKDISGDLGDVPVRASAYDWRTGSLYAATDWGVLTRPAGGTAWLKTPGLPQVAVYGLTLDDSGKQLYAATHGRGVFVDRIN